MSSLYFLEFDLALSSISKQYSVPHDYFFLSSIACASERCQLSRFGARDSRIGHTFFIRAPSFAGESLTMAPAASRAFTLSSAPPLPPEMMAPACPL